MSLACNVCNVFLMTVVFPLQKLLIASSATVNEHLYSSQRTDTDRKTDMYKRDKNYKTTHIIHKHTI